jgi:hypothetical protein
MPMGDEKPAIGFYTTRAIKADSAEEAVTKAKAQVADLWATSEYATRNKGALPILETEAVEEISYLEARRMPTKGHSFYEKE